MPFFLDDERRQEAPRPACPAVLLEEPVSLVAAMEVAAFDRLAEQLLGEGEESRDEEKEGGEPENSG